MKIIIGIVLGFIILGLIELVVFVLAHDESEDDCWQVYDDGWFEYYYCPKCGHKQQLTSDKKILPMMCPECKERLK